MSYEQKRVFGSSQLKNPARSLYYYVDKNVKIGFNTLVNSF